MTLPALQDDVNQLLNLLMPLIHADRDNGLSVGWVSVNSNEDRFEVQTVKNVDVKMLGHSWAMKPDINETIWQFFAEHPFKK